MERNLHMTGIVLAAESGIGAMIAAIAASALLIGGAVVLFVRTKRRKDREDRENGREPGEGNGDNIWK